MTDQFLIYDIVLAGVCCLATIANLLVLGHVVKLYTEFAKQRMQENR